MTKIGIASDHAGYEMKEFLVGYLSAMGYDVHDFGPGSPESVDYADYAHPLAEAVEKGEFECGIALCGSGEGMTMTLNKHQGIRAGLAWEPEIASLIRRHNNATLSSSRPASSPTTRPWRCSTPTSRRSSKADATSTASRRWPYPAASRLKNSRSGDACGSKTNAGSTDAMRTSAMRAAQMQSRQARWTADAIGAKATRTERMRCADSECSRYGSTDTTIRKCSKRSGKSRENRTPPARTASRATHRQAPESHPPKTGQRLQRKDEGSLRPQALCFFGTVEQSENRRAAARHRSVKGTSIE